MRRAALTVFSYLVVLSGILAAGQASAQNFPTRPVTIIVPFGPGSGNDVIARIVAQKVTENWRHVMVVENRPGATGGIAMEITSKSPPDGHTLIIVSTSQLINQFAGKVTYDVLRDFTGVSLAGTLPYVISVYNGLPARSMKELVELARRQPGKINYAGQVGGLPHFIGEMMNAAGGVKTVLVPYKSSSDAEADVASGRVEILITNLATTLRLVKAGKLRALGVSGDHRSPVMPDVPTMTEAGFPTLDVGVSFFILAPAATPKAIVNVLNAQLVKAMGSDEARDRLAATGVEPTSSSPEQLDALLKSEVARWSKVVRESGIRVE